MVVLDVPLVAAVAPDDDLAACVSMTAADLAGRTVLALPTGTGVRAAFDGAVADAGVAVHPALEAGSPPMLVDLASQGLRVAIVPQPAVAGRQDLVAVALAPEARARIVLTWRTDGPSSAAARALLQHPRDASDAVVDEQ